MTTLELCAKLLAIVKADEDNSSYRGTISDIAKLPLPDDRDERDVIYFASDVVHTLKFDTEDDGWIPENKSPFCRDELYDMWEANLIYEPCRGEGGMVRFQLRDE